LPEPSIIDTQKKIIEQSPDLLLLDYRLDEKPVKDNKIAEYKAGPVAQLFRDSAIEDYQNDIPIFAVSHEENIRLYEPDKTAHDLFDQIWFKSFFVDHQHDAVKQMISFIDAYKEIINCFNNGNRLHKLLQINPGEVGFIDSHFFKEFNKFKAPHLVSMNFFKTFIKRSWLLLDEDNLLAHLGVHPDDKESKHFKALIKIMAENDIGYSGIFGNGFQRWWANRLKVFFESRCSATLGDLTATERVEKISECLKLKFKTAVSRWTNNSDTYVSFACSSCKNPTEVEYSVSAYDPVHHPVIGKNRICWRCIQTGEYEEKGILVDDSDEFTADKIRHGRIVFG
ncbi:MAG: hypothetical protein JRJ85_06850, partial [Deltaproteobacteria bacterium]|nr:hypothetical protein [Deltaproteobacteria bacterium]